MCAPDCLVAITLALDHLALLFILLVSSERFLLVSTAAMSTYQGYPFQFSEPLETIGFAPDRFYSTLPVRVSKFSDQIRLAGEKAKEKLAARLGIDSKILIRNGTITSQGHLASWMFPECPPARIPTLVEMIELLFHFDGRCRVRWDYSLVLIFRQILPIRATRNL